MKIIALFISILTFSPLMGQRNLMYPELFGAFFNHQSLVNPSFQHDTGRVVFAASVKSRMGVFKNIATYYVSLDRNFMNARNAGHTVRLIFYNEKDGPYIERPRGYVNYAYRLPISRETFFSTGAAVGFTQLAYTAPSATATGTTTLPDLALGVYLNRKKLKVGVSSMQLLNNSSSSSNLSVKLGRYYNFFVGNEKQLGYAWTLKSYVLYRLLPEYRDHADIALLLSYKEIISFGSSVRYGQGTSFFASFLVNAGTSVLQFNFTYNTTLLSDNSALSNSFELSPSYILR